MSSSQQCPYWVIGVQDSLKDWLPSWPFFRTVERAVLSCLKQTTVHIPTLPAISKQLTTSLSQSCKVVWPSAPDQLHDCLFNAHGCSRRQRRLHVCSEHADSRCNTAPQCSMATKCTAAAQDNSIIAVLVYCCSTAQRSTLRHHTAPTFQCSCSAHSPKSQSCPRGLQHQA